MTITTSTSTGAPAPAAPVSLVVADDGYLGFPMYAVAYVGTLTRHHGLFWTTGASEYDGRYNLWSSPDEAKPVLRNVREESIRRLYA
jgi:hypothetical protein